MNAVEQNGVADTGAVRRPGQPTPDVPTLSQIQQMVDQVDQALQGIMVVHAQADSVREAARLLVATLLDRLDSPRPTGEPNDPAHRATAEASQTAQAAQARLAEQVAAALEASRASIQTLREALSRVLPEPVSHWSAGQAETREATDSFDPADLVGPSRPGAPAFEGAPGLTSMVSGSRLELQVSKFTSFADLNGYRDAVGSIPGVQEVKVRRVHRGTLFLLVDYDGIVPLADRLSEITEFPSSRVSTSGDTIQVALTSDGNQ